MRINSLDWLIIIGYFIALAAIGVTASLKAKDTENYFLGKRRFGRLLMIAQSFGVGTHSDMPVSLAGAVYSSGISAIWYQWKNLFATPFYWIMAPVFRRFRRTTTAEVMEDRYGAGMSGVYILFAVAFFTINIASILKGAAKILYEMLGSRWQVNHIVWGLALIFILYSFVGGLLASAWSDCLQGLLILALSFMLIPFGWGLVGGLAGMKRALPSYAFSLATPKEIGVWFIAMLTLNGLIGIMAQPHMMAAVGTGKDERACRVGFFQGNYLKRICTAGWAVVGLMSVVLVKQGFFGIHSLRDPEDAFGFACVHLLSPGFRGLFIASVMGASLASCSALMIDSGALFTQGLYRRHLAPHRPDRHYLWAGRLSGFAIVIVAILYAVFFIEKVLYSFLLTETMATYMGISIVAGLMWKRANRWGAVGSLLVALGMNFFLYHLKNERLDSWDPNIFLVSLAAGIVALVVVSLATRPEPESRVVPFFANLQTPSDLGTEDGFILDSSSQVAVNRAGLDSVGQAGSLQTAQSGRQSLLVNLLSLKKATFGAGFFTAYREDLTGLLVGSALSVGLVVAFWGLLRL